MSYNTERPSHAGVSIDTGRDVRHNIAEAMKQRKPQGVGWATSAGTRYD